VSKERGGERDCRSPKLKGGGTPQEYDRKRDLGPAEGERGKNRTRPKTRSKIVEANYTEKKKSILARKSRGAPKTKGSAFRTKGPRDM